MLRHGDLGEGAARVVRDDHRLVEAEPVDQLDDHPRECRRREVGVLLHRQLVAAERHVGHDAAEPRLGNAENDAAPEVAVHEHAVNEQHGRTLAALAVADGAAGDGYLVNAA